MDTIIAVDFLYLEILLWFTYDWIEGELFNWTL